MKVEAVASVKESAKPNMACSAGMQMRLRKSAGGEATFRRHGGDQ